MLKECFKEHRKKILDLMEENTLLLVFSRRKGESITNERYQVDRNYFYVSGVLEFDNVVVLGKFADKSLEMIYINPYDEEKAKRVGAPYSKEKVQELSGISDIYYLKDLKDDVRQLLNKVHTVYLDFEPNDDHFLSATEDLANQIKQKYPWIQIKNARELFAKCRMVKHEEEIEEIKKAIHITHLWIENILKNLTEAYEYQLESYFDQAIKYYGANGFAFPTIAASGKNATCLHYSENQSFAKKGDLILLDLWASCNMYCADITRTFPVSWTFTERQKQLYNIVLEAQEKVFKAAKPWVTINDLQEIVIKHYEEKLMEIGLIHTPEEVEKYYYHGISHHLGLDCHDLSKHKDPLQAGNIITNEPGLYIEEEGIWIRIEDDLLITEEGAICLSQEILKTVEDIEAFLKKN